MPALRPHRPAAAVLALLGACALLPVGAPTVSAAPGEDVLRMGTTGGWTSWAERVERVGEELEVRRLDSGLLSVVPTDQLDPIGALVLGDLPGVGVFDLVAADPGPDEVAFDPCWGSPEVHGQVVVSDLVLGADGVPDVVAADLSWTCAGEGAAQAAAVLRIGSAVPYARLAAVQERVPRVVRGGTGRVAVVVRSTGTGPARLVPPAGSDCPPTLPAGASCTVEVEVAGGPVDERGPDGSVAVAVASPDGLGAAAVATYAQVLPASPCRLVVDARGTAAVGVRVQDCESGVDEPVSTTVQRLRGGAWEGVGGPVDNGYQVTVAPLATTETASLRAVSVVRDEATGARRSVVSEVVRAAPVHVAYLAADGWLSTLSDGDTSAAVLREDVTGVDLAPDRQTLALTTVHGGRTALRLERRDGRLVREVPLGDHEDVSSPRFSADGRSVALTASMPDHVLVVDVASGATRVVDGVQGRVQGWSPDGRRVLLQGYWPGHGDYPLRWLDLATGRTTAIAGTERAGSADVSRQGAVAFVRRTPEASSVLQLVPAGTSRTVFQVPGQFSLLGSVRYSPDGQQLLVSRVASELGTDLGISVVDVRTGHGRLLPGPRRSDLAWDQVVSQAPLRPTVSVPTAVTGPRTQVRWTQQDPDDVPAALVARCRVDGGAWASCRTPWLTPRLRQGRHTVVVELRDLSGRWSPAGSTTWSVRGSDAFGRSNDWTGDGVVDVAGFLDGRWELPGRVFIGYGVKGDLPVAADYDGDGRADVAVFRPTTGEWFVRGRAVVRAGVRGDVPVVADYDGDGRADVAVYRPSTGTWYVRGRAPVRHGAPGDVPVVADYDGDGRADVAVYRPSTGTWYVRGRPPVQHGARGDVPAPADFDGDGRADLAVQRPSTGAWYVRGRAPVQLGVTGRPVPADHTGDGRADVAVYRNGTWYVQGRAPAHVGFPASLPV